MKYLKVFEWLVFGIFLIFIHENKAIPFPHLKMYLDPVHSVFTFRGNWSKSSIEYFGDDGVLLKNVLLAKVLVDVREKNFVAGPAFWNFFMAMGKNDRSDVEKKMKYLFCENRFNVESGVVPAVRPLKIQLKSENGNERYLASCE